MAKENAISQQSILFGIIGLLLGIVIAILFASLAVNNNNTDMMRMMGMNQRQEMMEESQDMMNHHEEGMSMESMVEELRGKTGDQFDKEFIELMIEHHQGAIDMASLAKAAAKHQEIKDLSDGIISAQTKEINLMKDWQKTWGY